MAPLAAGAERLGAELARTFDVPVIVLEGHAPEIPAGPAILVMTRGSALDRPPAAGPVLAVVLPDIDGALRRPSLDAAEDALRLAFRIAGWTVSGTSGRDAKEGNGAAGAQGDAGIATSVRGHLEPDVVVETREPEHHALQSLVNWDPEGFWRTEEELRRPLRLPPITPAIRLDVPGTLSDALARVRGHVAPGDDVVGPLPLDGGRRALLIRSQDRRVTLEALRPLRDEASRQGVDLRVDVDPVDLG